MNRVAAGINLLALLLLATAAQAGTVSMDWVTVGRPGNPANAYGRGKVDYVYLIGKYEVTNEQYAAFLNSAATQADPYALWHAAMGSDARGGITRSGAAGSYVYAAKANMANKPVNYVTYYSAARFANWLNNGQGSASTETGGYTLAGGMPTPADVGFPRSAGAEIYLPAEEEWHKAAYYDPDNAAVGDGGVAGWWLFPTRSNTFPTRATSDAAGNISNPGANIANFNYGVIWDSNGDSTAETGNVSTVGSAGALSAGPWGTYDMGGNVWEWNQAYDGAGGRGLHGCSWEQQGDYLYASRRKTYLGTFAQYNIGLRLVQLPLTAQSGLSVSANPALAGAGVTLTAGQMSVSSAALTYSWDFGDGSAPQTGATMTHTYAPAADTTYTVKVTITSRFSSLEQTAALAVLVATGEGSVRNIADGQPAIANDGVAATLAISSSGGGVLGFTVGAGSAFLNGGALTALQISSTIDTVGVTHNAAGALQGAQPIVKFTKSGLAVLRTTLTRPSDGASATVNRQIALDRREVGEAPATAAAPADTGIALKSFSGKLNFGGKAKNDSIKLSGTVELPAAFAATANAGLTLELGIGGIIDAVTLDAKGRQKTASTLNRISKAAVKLPKTAGSGSAGGVAQFSATIALQGMPAAGLRDSGITSATAMTSAKGVSRQVLVSLVLNGVAYESVVTITFAISKNGASGSLQLPR